MTTDPNGPQSITRICADCGQGYEIEPGEQNWYRVMGFVLPRRCSGCRQMRKREKQRGVSSDGDEWEIPL